MRILIALAQPLMPQQGGGSQVSALEIAGALLERGHEVLIGCQLDRKSIWGLSVAFQMKLRRVRYYRHYYRGVQVCRVPWITENIQAVLNDFHPEVALVQAMEAMRLSHAISASGVPTVVYFRDAQIHRMAGTPEGLSARYLANSEFTADFYRKVFNLQCRVVPPLIDRRRYEVPASKQQTVTLVGIYPEKGIDLALEVARLCPDIPFAFVESWKLSPAQRAHYLPLIQRLPRGKFIPHQKDMREVYRNTRVLLAPSQWEEAWGRVASEAHINGIPVVGSKIGGLAEAIGPGGIQIDPAAPAEVWASAIRSLWSDVEAYEASAERARAYAQRPSLNPSWQVAEIESELALAISDRSPQ